MADGPSENDVQSLVDQAMAEAQASIDDLKEVAQSVDAAGEEEAAASDVADAAALNIPDLTPKPTGKPDAKGIELLSDVDLHVTIELGRTQMLVEDVLKLGEGAVVELDKLAGDPVDVYVNQRLVARGEVLVLNDNFCIRVSEIVADLEAEAQAAAEMQAETSGTH
ncbi:MAG: flagellar motor switch protein FliN [Phycisphaera sp.]|nr:flagellar motor switch protein FliN [Phycisphaera sp.]